MPPCHGGGRGFEPRPVRKASARNAGVFAFMAYYVYIIYSASHDLYYKGSTENPVQRLHAHNADDSTYTRNKGPWQMIYLEELPTKKEMLILEKKLKRGNREYFEKLVHSPKNIVHQFMR